MDPLLLYRQHPLPPRSKCIRVLEVYARAHSEEEDAPIKCDLRTVDLESALAEPFSALTYVWGQKEDGIRTLRCGSFDLEITSNCHAALSHLRAKLGYFLLWVDAISINQDDDDEKMRQIALMGDIYSLADKVFVWLGTADDSTERTMSFLGSCGFSSFFSREEKKMSRTTSRR